MIEESVISDLVSISKRYAIKCHEQANHLYDGKPYSIHLQMVYDFGFRFRELLKEVDVMPALSACWTHDLIEDCRQTYNDVKKMCGKDVAEITYALTNEKGKNRKQRASEKYYLGIRASSVYAFVKICDRLANAKYSKYNKSLMIEVYRNEYELFKQNVYFEKFDKMFIELSEILW